VFHLELRHFPRSVNRFNLDQAELWQVLGPWVQERAVDVGEQRWSPHEAKLIVIEGPELAIGELSMGRGWRTALRRGTDVTAQVLAQARAAFADDRAAAATPAVARGAPLAPDAPIDDLLGADSERLLEAWSEIASRAPGLSPSEGLALAERRVAEQRAADAGGPATP
jgi:hypothetical protein